MAKTSKTMLIARTSSTMLKKSIKIGHSCVVPDLKENAFSFSPPKLKMELPYDPAILLLAIYPKNPEIPIQKNLCTPMFTAALFTIAKCWKQPKCL